MIQQLTYYENKLSFEMDPSDLFDVLSGKNNIVVIDARKPFGYDTEHFPGAINLPNGDMNEQTTCHLDKNALDVIYCDGIGCNASTRGARNMLNLGF